MRSKMRIHLVLALVLSLEFLVTGSLAQNCGSQGGGASCASGNCCSQYGYCGQGDAWCGTGCQSGACYSSGSGRCGSQGGGALCAGGLCCSQYGYCGSNSDYCGTGCQSGCPGSPSPPSSSCGSGVGGIVTQDLYNQIFPNRNSFFTYSAFISAADSYSGFGTAGDCTTRKRELAAFLAQISHETSGLFYISEINQNNDYCQESATYPCAPGKKYYGRGPMQLSWNYNYKQFGDSIGVDLVNNPELLATDAVISFKSAFWFWMTTQNPKPSCHNVMTGGWTPSASDSSNGRTATFGMTTLIINGGLECGTGSSSSGDTSRMNYYSTICGILAVSTGSGTSCANMTPY